MPVVLSKLNVYVMLSPSDTVVPDTGSDDFETFKPDTSCVVHVGSISSQSVGGVSPFFTKWFARTPSPPRLVSTVTVYVTVTFEPAVTVPVIDNKPPDNVTVNDPSDDTGTDVRVASSMTLVR
jgi:hypothetical protein